MRTLMQPFKINLVNTVLVGGEQFAFHMSELLLTFMGFTQLTLWWCFWFTAGYVTGRVEWMVHHFHQLHSNLMWKVSYPIWEFIIIPGSVNPISQSFLVPFQVRPKHHIYFHILPVPCSWDGLWDKDHGKKSGMVWNLAWYENWQERVYVPPRVRYWATCILAGGMGKLELSFASALLRSKWAVQLLSK